MHNILSAKFRKGISCECVSCYWHLSINMFDQIQFTSEILIIFVLMVKIGPTLFLNIHQARRKYFVLKYQILIYQTILKLTLPASSYTEYQYNVHEWTKCRAGDRRIIQYSQTLAEIGTYIWPQKEIDAVFGSYNFTNIRTSSERKETKKDTEFEMWLS